MSISSIREGDLIEVEKQGYRFIAWAGQRVGRSELLIEPVVKSLTWRRARSREVTGHWRRSGRRRTSVAA